MTQDEAATSIGISKRSLAGFETGERVPTGATRALIEAWMQQPKEEPPAVAADPAELAALQKQYDNLKERLRLEYQDRLSWIDHIDELEDENRRLKAEVLALRAQAASAALSREEARLLAEVADALGVPVDRGLAGVLERVRANLAAVGILSPPTVHDPSGDSGKTGGRPSVEPGPAGGNKAAGGA